jgi:hypothetical protein
MTATVYDDKFAHAQLAAEKYAKEQSAALENQVAEEQAALEEAAWQGKCSTRIQLLQSAILAT